MGGNLTSFFAELFGREGGCAGGRGGSVHLIDRSVGFYGSSPILGHSIALATGGALAFSMNKTRNVAVAFFGEGVLDEGSVWESFNFAAIHKLPVIFVCENNLYATEAPMKVRKPLNVNICEKVKGFGINAHQIDGNNVELMFQESKIAIEKCLNGEGPIFIECMTYRWLEHVGPFNDNVMGRTYRSADELLEWKQRCPIKKIEKNLLEQDYLAEKEMGEIRKQIDEQLSESFKNALLSPWPKAKDLFDNVN
jgi:pyruvate dehydrogenase E1 component alpha subunit